jgi:integrase
MTAAKREFRFSKAKLLALSAPPIGQRTTYRDSEVRGLELRITSTGAKSFSVFRRVKGGRPERITVGAFPAISVERARVNAKKYLSDLGEGISVSAQRRRSELEGKTLDEVHRDYLASRGITIITVAATNGESSEQPRFGTHAKLKPLTVRDYMKIVSKHLASWREKPLQRITRDMIEAKHRELSQTSAAQANLAMRYLRALFTFAGEYRDAEGQPIVTDNPVRRLSAMKLWNRVERRKRYIAPHDLRAWWAAVHSLENVPQHQARETLRDYFVLLILTGLRREEALTLRWRNVDLKRGTVTAVDTKNRLDHTLPMGKHLWQVMMERRDATDSEWVFANPYNSNRIIDPHRQIRNVAEASGVEFSPHDLRRTFASIVSRLGDRLSYYTTKRLLNHRNSDVTAGYVQFDIEQLRNAMQAVEDFVLKHVGTKPSGKVIRLSKGIAPTNG